MEWKRYDRNDYWGVIANAIIYDDGKYNYIETPNVTLSVDKLTFNVGAIADVKVFKDKDGNDKSIKIWFNDGTFTQATVQGDDKFNLENGITICMLKKMLGGGDDATKRYNNLVRDIVRVYNTKTDEERKTRAKREAIEKKREKRALKKARKAERKRQEQINMIAEAIRIANGEK